jgi:hypothetical protein
MWWNVTESMVWARKKFMKKEHGKVSLMETDQKLFDPNEIMNLADL